MGAQKSGVGLASALSGVLLLFISLRVFSQIQDTLNIIWKVEKKTGQILKRALKGRLISLVMLVAAGVLLLSLFLVDTVLQIIGSYVIQYFPNLKNIFTWRVSSFFPSFLTFSLLLSLIYRYVPHTRIAWRDVWAGSLLTSLLLLLSRFLLTFYFRYSHITSLYGAAGSIIVLLLWIYISAQIFLFGAEFCWVFAHQFGSRNSLKT